MSIDYSVDIVESKYTILLARRNLFDTAMNIIRDKLQISRKLIALECQHRRFASLIIFQLINSKT